MFSNKIKLVIIVIFVLSVNLFCSKITLFVSVCYSPLETVTNIPLSSSGSTDDNASLNFVYLHSKGLLRPFI